jgi:type IV pilus assembly protein PilM
MLFSKKQVGVDLSRHSVKMALLDGSSTACKISAAQERSFEPGSVTLTHREFSMNSPDTVAERIRDAYNCLNTRVKKSVVTLPDNAGKLLVLTMNERFKNHAEGMEIIRWKLKKRVSIDQNELHFDYQILEELENGELSILVAFVSRTVVERIELLFREAGLETARIEFNCMSLHRPFAGHLDNSGASGLISFHGDNLGIMFMQEGVPRYIRSKELQNCKVTDPRLFMEMKNTFVSWRERNKNRMIDTIHTLSPPNISSRFEAMVTELTGITPLPFSISDIIPLHDADNVDRAALYPFAAAIGAAWRAV